MYVLYRLRKNGLTVENEELGLACCTT